MPYFCIPTVYFSFLVALQHMHTSWNLETLLLCCQQSVLSNGCIIGFWMVQSYKHAIWFHENRYGSDYHKELSMPYFGLYFWILYSITKILSLNFKPTMLFQYWHIWSWCFYCEACSLVNIVWLVLTLTFSCAEMHEKSWERR